MPYPYIECRSIIRIAASLALMKSSSLSARSGSLFSQDRSVSFNCPSWLEEYYIAKINGPAQITQFCLARRLVHLEGARRPKRAHIQGHQL